VKDEKMSGGFGRDTDEKEPEVAQSIAALRSRFESLGANDASAKTSRSGSPLSEAITQRPVTLSNPKHGPEVSASPITIGPSQQARLLEFETGDDVRVLPCEKEHRYHQACIDPWCVIP